MAKVIFEAKDLKGMMEHVINTEDAKLMLVHDQGVYLMSQGYKVENDNIIVYSQGCNPKINEDWYDTAHALVGGDDFVEYLDAEFAKAVLEQIEAENQEITILLSKDSIKLGKPKKIKSNNLIQTPAPTNFETVETDKGVVVIPKIEEIQLKPAQAIKQRFTQLVNDGKITEEILKILTDKELTAQAFKVRYAFLKEFDSTVPIKELTYINGSPRYYSKPITLNDKEYLMCNDLYAKTVEKFMEWSNTL